MLPALRRQPIPPIHIHIHPAPIGRQFLRETNSVISNAKQTTTFVAQNFCFQHDYDVYLGARKYQQRGYRWIAGFSNGQAFRFHRLDHRRPAVC